MHSESSTQAESSPMDAKISKYSHIARLKLKEEIERRQSPKPAKLQCFGFGSFGNLERLDSLKNVYNL